MASESCNEDKGDSDQTQAPPSKFAVVKNYQPRGQLTLHRLSFSTTFTCGRCNKEKTAKLVATYRNRWDDLRCNGCYGKLQLQSWSNEHHKIRLKP
jgi:hypothetical protein